MAVWCEAPYPLALRSPPAQWSHVGLDPGLVDEDQALWIQAGLPRLPAATSLSDIGATLLKGE